MRSILLLIVAVMVSVGISMILIKPQSGGGVETKAIETAYERVIRTGTIRCGYGVGAPYVEMDPNTKEMSGFAVEVMEAIGRNLNLKIEWIEETGWGGLTSALNNGRVDVGCSSLWVSAPVAREALFSDIYLFNAMFFWVREDNETLQTLNDLNRKNVKIGYIEGDNTQKTLTNRILPKAATIPYSRDLQSGVLFMEVAADKIDAVLNDPPTIAVFNERADIKLRAVSPEKPTVTVGNAFPLPKNEVMLKNMIDTAISEMLASGELAQIMKPYQEATPDAFFLPSDPYKINP